MELKTSYSALKEGINSQVEASSKAVINMLSDGVRLDRAFDVVRKSSGLNGEAWGYVVETVTRSLQVFDPRKNNPQLNGLGNPAVAAVVNAVAPIVAAYAARHLTKPQQLGAVEILEQNNQSRKGVIDDYSFDGKPIFFKGFRPSYKQLASYDSLIDRAGNYGEYVGDLPALSDTIGQIREAIQSGVGQVGKLASHLYDSDPRQACFNVWHFLKKNVGYSLERYEQLRMPARSWADRKYPKVDCDCYSIFGGALLTAMGYRPELFTVGFGEGFRHIYVLLSGTVIDPVMDVFDTHPQKIKEMKTWVLHGIPGADDGTGAPAMFAENGMVQRLHAEREQMLSQPDNPEARKEVRKINFVLSLQGKPHFAPYFNIMRLIDDVDGKGRFSWKKPVNLFTAEDLRLVDEVADALESADAYDEIDVALEGLGRKKPLTKEEKEKRKTAKKQLARQRVEERKEANKGVPLARRIGRGFARVEPLMASGRSAFLALTAWNFRGMASNMSWGVLPDDVLQKNGLSPAQIKDVKTAWQKASVKWADIGGNPGKLRDAIKKGMKRKPVFGGGKKAPKALKGLGGLGDIEREIYEVVTSMHGLGNPAAIAAYVTAGATVVGLMSSLIGQLAKASGKKPVTGPPDGADTPVAEATDTEPETDDEEEPEE